jgi:flagellar hook-length control protein FliK
MDPGSPAANTALPADQTVGAGRTSATATATPVDRIAASAPAVLALPDAHGREVTARLVVTGGGHGQSLRIELQPADLGRVEVSLQLHDHGAAAATFTADCLETLQLLQRDARTVTEMLTAAGFTVDQDSLGFALRDGGNDSGQPRQPPAEPQPRGWHRLPEPAPADEPQAGPRQSLLDLHV